MVLARLLAPADFGVGAAVNLVIQLSSRLTQLGLSAALTRLKTMDPKHESTAFICSGAIGIGICTALYLGADLAGRLVNSVDASRAIPLAALTFLIGPFGVGPSARLYRDLRFQDMATADLIDLLVGYLVTIGCALLGMGYWSFVWGGLAGNVLAVAFRIHRTGWRPSFTFSRQAWQDIASFGLGVQAKRILEFAGQNLDTLIVGQTLGMVALGFYDRSFSFMNTIANRLVIAPGVSFRIFSVIRDDRDRFLRAYQRLVGAILLAAMPLFAVLCVCAPEVFAVLFGERWAPAVPAFRILTVSAVLQILSSVTNPANEAAGQLWAQVWRQASFAALVAGGVWTGARFGITGAAVAVAVAGLARMLMMTAVLKRATGWSWADLAQPLGPAVLVAATLAVFVSLARWVLWQAHASPLALVLTEAGLTVVFGAMVILWCPLQAVRSLVTEFVDDLAPKAVQIRYRRWARPVDDTNVAIAETKE